jgi:Siphovirus Gp157
MSDAPDISDLSLFDVSRQLVELMAFRDNEDLQPDERDAVEKEIARYVAAEITKVDNVRWYLRHCEVMEKAHREEADRQTRMAHAWEERQKRLKDYAIRALEAAGKTRVEGKTGVLKIQKNGGQIPMEIFDETSIPTRYTPMTITYPIDKEAVRRDLSAGKEVPGARLLERGVHLRVE